MMLQATVFGLGVLVAFCLLGFGLTAWMLPDARMWLATPIVGLATAAIGFQLLTPILPPWVTLLVLLVGLGPFSVRSAWRERAQFIGVIRTHAAEGAFTMAAGFILYLGLLAHVFGASFFTLAGWPSDNIFLYAPAAEFLRTHAFNAAHALSLVDNPTTRYLAVAATIFPNSVGPLDGATSVLSGWQVAALFDPLSAVLYALVVPATYLLLSLMGVSRTARIVGILLLIANQLLYWVMGNAFQQEMEAMPVFIGSLALTLYAARRDRPGAAILAGLVGGSLVGLYLPLFVIYAICALGYLAVDLVQRWRARQSVPLFRQLAWLGGSGLAASAASLYWLLPGGGLHFWLEWLGTRIPAGGVTYFYAPRYLLGVAPIADPWRPPSIPLLWWRPEWNGISRWLAVLVAALVALGAAAFALNGRLPELGLIGAAALYLAYLRLVAQYPYGFTKAVSFLAPLTSALIAVGALELIRAVRAFREPEGVGAGRGLRLGAVFRLASAAGSACVALVLAAETIGAVEMEHLWLAVGPQAFPASFKQLSALQRIIPSGGGVVLVNPSPAYHDGIKYAAARYYLTDHNVVLDERMIPQSQLTFHYDYVVTPWPPDTVDPGPEFKRVWSDSDVGLALYQRVAVGGSSG